MIDSTQSFRFFNRGPSPVVRLAFFSMLSFLLMFVDARYRYMETFRTALSVVISPIQHLATMPGVLLDQAGDFFITQSTQHSLMKENEELRLQHQTDAAQLLQFQGLQMENQQLRKLSNLPIRNEFTSQLVEISYAEGDIFNRKVLVNKGSNANIEPGQIVIDDAGIIGQVTRVFPWLSEVTLITEKDHTVPVKIVRNGLRTILFGTGDTSQLSIRYMPVSSDIQNDDVLVTSGIDGVYPPDIPVAKVTKIERDAAYPFARVTCLPLAGVDNHRHLLILSSLPKLPDRPTQTRKSDSDKRIKAKRAN